MNKIDSSIKIHGNSCGFVYILKTSAHYKIGHSRNVDGTVACAQRFDAGVRLVTCWPTGNPKDIEGILHSGLADYRREGEQFELPDKVVQWVASLDDREFGGWASEHHCDPRSIGWDFPRVYSEGGSRRMWPCLLFPENDRVSWAMIGHDGKPDYSLVENLWATNPIGFNSFWLGRPLKWSQPGGRAA